MNQRSNLSPAEWRLLQALSQGHANKHIARELCRSENTVRNQLSGLYRKIGARNRTLAAHWYLDGRFARETRKTGTSAPLPRRPAQHRIDRK